MKIEKKTFFEVKKTSLQTSHFLESCAWKAVISSFILLLYQASSTSKFSRTFRWSTSVAGMSGLLVLYIEKKHQNTIIYSMESHLDKEKKELSQKLVQSDAFMRQLQDRVISLMKVIEELIGSLEEVDNTTKVDKKSLDKFNKQLKETLCFFTEKRVERFAIVSQTVLKKEIINSFNKAFKDKVKLKNNDCVRFTFEDTLQLEHETYASFFGNQLNRSVPIVKEIKQCKGMGIWLIRKESSEDFNNPKDLNKYLKERKTVAVVIRGKDAEKKQEIKTIPIKFNENRKQRVLRYIKLLIINYKQVLEIKIPFLFDKNETVYKFLAEESESYETFQDLQRVLLSKFFLPFLMMKKMDISPDYIKVSLNKGSITFTPINELNLQ